MSIAPSLKTRTRRAKPKPAPQPKPFLKWVGGKRGLLPKLMPLIPAFPGDYHEPFLGGGALFFAAYRGKLLDGRQVHLSDSNAEVMDVYRMVRDRADDLITELDLLRSGPHNADTYYQFRAQDPTTSNDAERAARTIWLNRNCRSGIYRVNQKGGFNTPYGKYKKPGVVSPDLLRVDSSALQGTAIACLDFRQSLQAVQSGDFVYLDPPYFGTFDKYTAATFPMADHEDLAVEFERLAALGAYVMMSNSATDWVRDRYSAYQQVQVMAKRSINRDGKKRGPVPELIILGWQPAAPVVLPAVAAVK